MSRRPARLVARLVVDPVACDGRGVCAELLPEIVTLDRWGYPIVGDGAVTADMKDLAAEAAASCPRHALHVVEPDS